jgi:putative polyhydroxyalkanoic acid system protein
VRVTISHTHSKEEVKQAVDRAFDGLFSDIGTIPLPFADQRKSWQGSTLTFSLSAKMGVMSTPIRGTIDVTDKDLTIDADLGIFERLLPATKVREALDARIRGLLR